MAPNGDKIRVTARITRELDTSIHRYYTNVAPAIIEGLELLVATREDMKSPDWHQPATGGIGEMMARIGDMARQIDFLKRQIDIKDSQLEKQAYSLQSLIQVNSAFNMKLLSEKAPVHPADVQPAVEEPDFTTLDSVIQNEESNKKIETVKAEDPEVLSMRSKFEQVAATAQVMAKEIVLEEQHEQPLTEVPQHVPVSKTQKNVKAKPAKEIECVNCGKIFTAERSTRKFCSKKCATAYYRKEKKDIIE